MFHLLSRLGLALVAIPTVIASACTLTTFEECIQSELSSGATLETAESNVVAPRWTEYKEPVTGHVVNVATEADVQAAVRCANEAGVKFFAQSGGNAWATTWNLSQGDVVIDLRALNAITFNDNRTQVQVEGGAIISELVDAAYANNTQVVTANCNCVGVMGALLGGGYSRMMGERGFMVDNVLSLRVVLASGELVEVTPTSHPDLWWALRGAGANFGIVTSAVFKAYPTPAAQNGAWLGSLIFGDDQLEDVVSAINNLTLTSKMAIFLYYATTGAPDYTPAIIVFPFYLGNNTAEARQAFASVLDIGPVTDGTTFTPYNEVNEGSNSFCVAGNRKVSYGAAEGQLDPTTWRAIWNEYTSFIARYGGAAVGNSTVLMEAYSLGTAEQLGDGSSAYAWRSTNRFNTVAIAWYADAGLDVTANAWAGQIRDHWRSTSGLKSNSTYINFAFGDETLEDIYGGNVAQLQQLKGVYDPDNHFGQFFPLERAD